MIVWKYRRLRAHTHPSIHPQSLPSDGWSTRRISILFQRFHRWILQRRVEYVLFEDGDKIDGGGIIFEG